MAYQTSRGYSNAKALLVELQSYYLTQSWFFNLSFIFNNIAQLAIAEEHTNCTSAEG